MDIRDGKVLFTKSEQGLADLPAKIELSEVESRMEGVFNLADRYSDQIFDHIGDTGRAAKGCMDRLNYNWSLLFRLGKNMLDAAVSTYKGDELAEHLAKEFQEYLAEKPESK